MAARKRIDKTAWVREAISQYEAPLLRYVRRLTGSAETARDIVQETFMALSGEDAGQMDGHLRQWLYTVSRRRALDFRRKESRMTCMTQERIDSRAGTIGEPATIVGDREESGQVERLVCELPENQQE